jgi:hypothetical protein
MNTTTQYTRAQIRGFAKQIAEALTYVEEPTILYSRFSVRSIRNGVRLFAADSLKDAAHLQLKYGISRMRLGVNAAGLARENRMICGQLQE